MPEGISSEESRAKIFDSQEAARIRQAIQEAQQAQPIIGSERTRVPYTNSDQIKEAKSTVQEGKEQVNQPITTTIRPPEIHLEEVRAKVYTAEQLGAVRKAIAIEQAQKPISENNEK